MHAGSALHVAASSFVSDYGTWFCFFLLTSSCFSLPSLSLPPCPACFNCWGSAPRGRRSIVRACTEVASASLVPTLGRKRKTFHNHWTHPEPFCLRLVFPSCLILNFLLWGAQKSLCQMIIVSLKFHHKNNTAIFVSIKSLPYLRPLHNGWLC